MVSEVPPASFKFIVNSVMLQHSAYGKSTGPRGMHAASGSYWDDSSDGSTSYTVVGTPETGRDFDVVITVAWISI